MSKWTFNQDCASAAVLYMPAKNQMSRWIDRCILVAGFLSLGIMQKNTMGWTSMDYVPWKWLAVDRLDGEGLRKYLRIPDQICCYKIGLGDNFMGKKLSGGWVKSGTHDVIRRFRGESGHRHHHRQICFWFSRMPETLVLQLVFTDEAETTLCRFQVRTNNKICIAS